MIQAAPLPLLPSAWLLKKKLIANCNKFKSDLFQKYQIIIFVNSGFIKHTAIAAQAAFDANITAFVSALFYQFRFSNQ